jgi:nicotinate phosphoribosyltransferase
LWKQAISDIFTEGELIMIKMDESIYALMCDFYELTMGNGYLKKGLSGTITYFDVFFRKIPDDGGFAIAAGLEQVIEYIENLRFSEEDIAFLRGKGVFSEEFLSYLADFKFSGDIYAVPEGTPVFPYEPILTVRAPALDRGISTRYTAF